MLAVFCLRLAAGMIGCLLLLSPAQVHPRFYRVHFLVALGLAALVLAASWGAAAPWAPALLGLGLVLAFAGSFAWSLEGAPGGRTLIVLTTAALAGALAALEAAGDSSRPLAERLVGDFTSAALLGGCMTAMLLGHNYLVAPGMSIRPLMTVLAALAVAAVARLAVEGVALAGWTGRPPLARLSNDVLLFLPVRWILGFVGPLALNGMAWQTAKIRSTQSATGILYVVVIFCFLGELTSQLLRETGVTL
jgi:hypothetical protein